MSLLCPHPSSSLATAGPGKLRGGRWTRNGGDNRLGARVGPHDSPERPESRGLQETEQAPQSIGEMEDREDRGQAQENGQTIAPSRRRRNGTPKAIDDGTGPPGCLQREQERKPTVQAQFRSKEEGGRAEKERRASQAEHRDHEEERYKMTQSNRSPIPRERVYDPLAIRPVLPPQVPQGSPAEIPRADLGCEANLVSGLPQSTVQVNILGPREVGIE